MHASYQSAIARMFALGHELAQTPSHKFDLAHMRTLLEALEHPEKKFPAVLIAGTNGKGSTAATLASIVQASGLKTGLYTSPHLVRINERIRINGASISDDVMQQRKVVVGNRRAVDPDTLVNPYQVRRSVQSGLQPRSLQDRRKRRRRRSLAVRARDQHT